MPTLTITRGLPASGKTTWARLQVISGHGHVVRVNRDDIRASVFGARGKARFDHATEQAVTAVQQAAVRALLRAGRDVIVDDMNLRLKYARAWADLAVEEGADFRVEDFDMVPVDLCVERDAARLDSVGEDVIRGLHDRFTRGKNFLPPVTPTEAVAPTVRPYARPDAGEHLPEAWLVDIDGTLALMRPGGRSPYDWARVGEDDVNEPVAQIVAGLFHEGYEIVLMSGREDVCRRETEAWLKTNKIPYAALFMRKEGDNRKDAVVKDELFEAHVRDAWDIQGVIDDRQQVVAMWRAKGLTVAQVAEGRF